jgi:high affinity Mn2+ porin
MLFETLLAALQTAMPAAISAPSPSPSPSAGPGSQRWSLHAQATNLQQYHGEFAAAYSGPQSLYSKPDTAKTFSATLFLGARLWKGGELYVNPELDQGFGLGFPNPPGASTPYSGTFGVAGFVSGEAYKVGSASMYERVQRLFLRQTFNFGAPLQSVEPDINQLGDSVSPEHLTLTFGKFGVTDVFDTNPYAHDPSNDFMNWSIIDMGSFDYAADAWGYTYGLSGELVSGESTVRAGVFQLSTVPNTIAIEPVPFLQYSPIVEFERRTSLFGGHPGAIKALFYGDYGFMGSYADAIAAAAGTREPPSTASVRTARHWKLGGGINLYQEVAPHIGIFSRLSAMNGTYEAFEFTDVDRSASAGLSIDGGLYHRESDSIGVAGVVNAISAPAQQYFGAGGLGILVGDGALSYAAERILEAYYKVGFGPNTAITADYQFVRNPAYNTARGPVAIFGLRYHVQI